VFFVLAFFMPKAFCVQSMMQRSWMGQMFLSSIAYYLKKGYGCSRRNAADPRWRHYAFFRREDNYCPEAGNENAAWKRWQA
jgi:hypothetical protein